MKNFAVGMHGGFKANARGAVQLGNNDTLSSIDDKCALDGHERKLTHVNFFLFCAALILVAEGHIERRTVGETFALGLQSGHFRLTEFVTYEIE